MGIGDWIGLGVETLCMLVLAAIFFDGVRIDVIEPWLADRRAHRFIERKIREQEATADG